MPLHAVFGVKGMHDYTQAMYHGLNDASNTEGQKTRKKYTAKGECSSQKKQWVTVSLFFESVYTKIQSDGSAVTSHSMLAL